MVDTDSILAITVPIAFVLIFGGIIFGIAYENITESEFENCIEQCDYALTDGQIELDCMLSCHKYFLNETEEVTPIT